VPLRGEPSSGRAFPLVGEPSPQLLRALVERIQSEHQAARIDRLRLGDRPEARDDLGRQERCA